MEVSPDHPLLSGIFLPQKIQAWIEIFHPKKMSARDTCIEALELYMASQSQYFHDVYTHSKSGGDYSLYPVSGQEVHPGNPATK